MIKWDLIGFIGVNLCLKEVLDYEFWDDNREFFRSECKWKVRSVVVCSEKSYLYMKFGFFKLLLVDEFFFCVWKFCRMNVCFWNLIILCVSFIELVKSCWNLFIIDFVICLYNKLIRGFCYFFCVGICFLCKGLLGNMGLFVGCLLILILVLISWLFLVFFFWFL